MLNFQEKTDKICIIITIKASILLQKLLAVLNGCDTDQLQKDLVEVGLRAKALLQCDLEHGQLSCHDEPLGIVDPFLHGVGKGGHVHISGKDGMEVIGGDVDCF